MIKDVHTEHCCLQHGCKYGYLSGPEPYSTQKECTVLSGRAEQSYPCEICGWEQEEIEFNLPNMPDDQLLDELVLRKALFVVHENHLFVHVTEDLHPGFRSGRRCTKCRQWAMGETIGGKADKVCPKARIRYQSEWTGLIS